MTWTATKDHPADTVHLVRDADGGIVARAFTNADLISAAPDLLSVARYVASACGRYEKPPTQGEVYEMFMRANAAVAKAEGRAP